MAFGGQYNEDAAFAEYKRKLSSKEIEYVKSYVNSHTSEEKEEGCKKIKGACDRFLDTDEYASGDKTYLGYISCCDLCSHCGLSGWVIFLIIFLVLGVLAGGAAAFWFFYWKRKYGGKEEMVEENTESTENSKTVFEIPVGTY
ncbi:unnamed protein product [Caenorhabditis brenneri]